METTNYQPSTINQQSSDEISLKELIQKLGDWYRYLKTQWWKIAIAGILGGGLGFVYAWMQPITYTAKTTFVVEESKVGGGLSGLASLAGQFGVDVNSASNGGVISGDNILLYFQSESLAREVLTSQWNVDKNKSIVDIYIERHGLRKKWARNKKIGNVSFPPGHVFSRLQDSLLEIIITKHILKNQFTISKIDKKASFIQLIVKMEDELLAKQYSTTLIEIAVKRYLALKTERQQKTVDRLQARVDSISSVLYRKTSTSAALQTLAATMDVNPLYKTNSAVVTELTLRDKTMLSTVYAEVIKNLELAKFTLSQETPVIQIVDYPRLPLKESEQNFLLFSILFSVSLTTFYVVILIISNKMRN